MMVGDRRALDAALGMASLAAKAQLYPTFILVRTHTNILVTNETFVTVYVQGVRFSPPRVSVAQVNSDFQVYLYVLHMLIL